MPAIIMARGAVAIFAGFLVLTQPGGDNLLALLAVLGVLWLVGAALELATLRLDRSWWPARLLAAGLQVWAGLTVLRQPLWSTLLVPATLVSTLGTLGVAIGVVQILPALGRPGRGVAALAALDLVQGVILLACPLRALVLAAAAWLVVAGAGALTGGLRLRHRLRSAQAVTGRKLV